MTEADQDPDDDAKAAGRLLLALADFEAAWTVSCVPEGQLVSSGRIGAAGGAAVRALR